MLQDKYINKIYYHNSNGNIDPIFNSLECLQKIEYMLYRNCEYPIYKLFLDDINPIFKKNIISGKGTIYCKKMFNKKEYFQIKKLNFYQKDCVDFLIIQLSKAPVIINTCFDMLPCYHWFYEETGEKYSQSHYCMLLGADNTNYFFVEDPILLREENNHRLKENPEISFISKEIMNEALLKRANFSIIYSINIPKTISTETNNIIKEVYEVYNTIKPYAKDEYITYFGRMALVQLISYLKNHNEFIDIMSAIQWQIHVIMSRHFLFQLYFEAEANDISKVFSKAKERWEVLQNLFIMQNIKGIYSDTRNTIRVINDILLQEDELIKECLYKMI